MHPARIGPAGRALAAALALGDLVLWTVVPYGRDATHPPTSYGGALLDWLDEFGPDAWWGIPLLVLAQGALLAPTAVLGRLALSGDTWTLPRWAWIAGGLAILPLAALAAFSAALSITSFGWGTPTTETYPVFWLVPALAGITGLWALARGIRAGPDSFVERQDP